jgi:hypothetical protein
MEDLEEVKEAPIAQKEKKPRSQAQIDAFQKARDKRLLLASQKKLDEAKKISDKVKTEKPKPVPKPVEVEEDDEPEIRVVKKPKKKKIIYQVESDSEEEVIVKRKEKKELPPPPPAEPIKIPSKPTPVYVFL